MLEVVSPARDRALQREHCTVQLAVVGGGLAGVCCAITAARMGVRVILVQDRPVLGGNGSSEVRLWVLGATSHMGNNNRWAREGGVIDEILVENLWRNPEGNPIFFDALLLEKVTAEPNICLLLNTAVHSVETSDDGRVRTIEAFCSQNETTYTIDAELFCDSSGDGIVAFLAGAPFRIGAELQAEFDEGFAPAAEYGSLLGHSLYFYSRDTGKPVRFTPPAFALENVSEILRFRELKASDSGCRLWWLEYGGRLDTVHQTEEIKWELWKVAYGLWNHIKNSGEYPEAENLTLEWVGTIAGKRESRRFEGDYILRQADVVEQTHFPDAVSFGGWAMDLHPADGVYSSEPGCTQWHPRGVYAIPYRCMYSRTVDNLFLSGRIISVTHVAFGSTRVMATSAHNGQAVGVAAALCLQMKLSPRQLAAPENIHNLQQALLRRGQYIPGVRAALPSDLANSARLSASSTLQLSALPPSGDTLALDTDRAMLLPLQNGPLPEFSVRISSTEATTLRAELWIASQQGIYTPSHCVATRDLAVPNSPQPASFPIQFNASLNEPRYGFLVLRRNPALSVATSSVLVTGIIALSRGVNPAVAKSSSQQPPAGIGVDSFDFWLPQRRPSGGHNLAIEIAPPLRAYAPENVNNGFHRPYIGTNAWVADSEDKKPRLTLTWDQPVKLRTIILRFDTDFDHAMESVLMGHGERAMPFCVRHYQICDELGRLLHTSTDNHQTVNEIVLSKPVRTRQLVIEILEMRSGLPAIFGVSCFSEAVV